jgi:ribosome-binding protein aMBF1 (putative translation factor)
VGFGGNKDRKGAKNPNSRLTMEQVRRIRAEFGAGGVSMKTLAEQHSVSVSAISDIVRGRSWNDDVDGTGGDDAKQPGPSDVVSSEAHA